MINNNIITILKSVNTITNSAVLRYPITVLNSQASDIYIKVDMSILDEDSFEDIGIYNLSEFLNIFGLYGNERNIKQENNIITVSDNTGSISTFVTDDIGIMQNFDKDPSVFNKTKVVDTVCTFELTKDNMKKLKTASNIYKNLNDFNIVSRDSDITLEITQNNSFGSNSNSHKQILSGVTTKEFNISLPIINFNMLPLATYEVQVKYNLSANAYRVLLVCKDIEGIEVIMSVNV